MVKIFDGKCLLRPIYIPGAPKKMFILLKRYYAFGGLFKVGSQMNFATIRER
jgi:hypothetical protein